MTEHSVSGPLGEPSPRLTGRTASGGRRRLGRARASARSGLGAFAAGCLVATAVGAGLVVSASPAFADTTVTFAATGAAQVWTVPAGVDHVTIVAAGGQGGDGSSLWGAAGLGGETKATVSVAPGAKLQIDVGGLGGAVDVSSPPGVGGFNGGGDGGDGLCVNSDHDPSRCPAGGGGWPGAGGGGASDVRVAPFGLGSRVVTAGGGGGAAAGSTCSNKAGDPLKSDGGAGGGLQAGDAPCGGHGGGQTSGGAGGGPGGGGVAGGAGTFGQGGAGATGSVANGQNPQGGGGAGGGWYGGGGGGMGVVIGAAWGGGGGSGNGPAAATYRSGVHFGAGNVTITYHLKASPTATTQASPGTLVGGPVRDVATLAGGSGPTGSVTFRLFSDNTCATQVFTSTNTLSGLTANSDWFTPAAVGTYWWTAAYNGDANNNTAASPCLAPNESVVIAPFVPPPLTRTITGDFAGPLTVNAGESVLITKARVVGPVTVNPGGALSVVNSQISGGIAADGPGFFSVCGSQVSGPSTTPGRGIVVSGAAVPIRIGDPANGCPTNRVAGDVSLTTNTAGLTLGANIVSGNVTVNTNGPGNTVVKANNIFTALACAGNSPPPTNAGQINTAGSKSGQCSTL